jgi:uncharacterized protein YndB with AHSA1/START domain
MQEKKRRLSMTKTLTSDTFGTLTAADTLTFQRLLPGPIERVWSYLVESDLRRKWLAAGGFGMTTGAPVEFVWRNDELNNPPSKRPAGFPEEQRMQGRVVAINPPRELVIAWNGFGETSYVMEQQGSQVLLVTTQSGLPNRDVIVMFAAGTHTHLDILAACLASKEPPLFWDNWSRLQKDYDQRVSR